jgi:hypothetical protein
MQAENPYLWPYTPANSPLPLPESPILVTKNTIHYLENQGTDFSSDDSLNLKQIQDYCVNHSSKEKKVDELLAQENVPLIGERRPFLLLGELANPFQLNRLNIGPMPIFIIRLEGLCRTYADSLDPRMIQPGIHHVTLARSNGWWEKSHLAMATIEQMKAMVNWLSNGRGDNWKPVKPAEGNIRFESNYNLQSPTFESMEWDGSKESVKQEMPVGTGPVLEMSQVMAPIHIQAGCYDSRGKIIRCAHIGQRDFHTNYFRRGSSKKWQDLLKIQ